MSIYTRNRPNNPQKRKVLWINPVPLDTFLHQTYQLEILTHLAKRGHNAVLLATRSRNADTVERSQLRIISVPFRFVPLLSPVMITIALFLFLPLYMIVSKPDFMITQPDFPIVSFIPGLVFSKLKRTRFVLDIRSTPVETLGFRGFQQKFWFAVSVLLARSRFDGITTITTLMKKDICRRFGIDPSKVGVWTSGVSTKLFDPESCVSQSAKLRRKLGLHDKFIVFHHGVFTATRGLKETIESMKILKRTCPDVVMFFLGTGPFATTLKDWAQNNELRDNVIIHDPVDYTQVPEFINLSDLCIVPLPNHPYWRFQCPQKLLEYLAMEKVVILTDIPAHRAIIGEEKCGIYIRSIKPPEMAKGLLFAYHNKDKLEKWGESGRAIVEEKYTWEKVAEDLEKYLLSIG